jgi:hypothetical protein
MKVKVKIKNQVSLWEIYYCIDKPRDSKLVKAKTTLDKDK